MNLLKYYLISLFVGFTGCYTLFYEAPKPVKYIKVINQDHFLPTKENYPEFDSLAALFKHWIYSNKESYNSVYVFRPATTWKAIPSRVIETLNFQIDGKYELSSSGPTDNLIKSYGIGG